MITTIALKPHLSEYLRAKYFRSDAEAVVLPQSSDLYVVIANLMSKRPSTNPVDVGNTPIMLPNRRDGKNPVIYNYLSERSVRHIERIVETNFWAEVHEYMSEQKHRYGVDYLTSASVFLLNNRIEGISEDALTKNYYRYRERKSQHRIKRKYQRNNMTTSRASLSSPRGVGAE